MRYYATIKSENQKSRPAKKGGDLFLEVELTKKGIPHAKVILSDLSDEAQDGGFIVEWPNGSKESIRPTQQ